MLCRLGMFAGPITLASAAAVASDDQVAAEDVTERLANLVAKSLVVAEVGHAVTFYRLLDTTRAYAIEKLIESGELADSARHNARRHFERMLPQYKPSAQRSHMIRFLVDQRAAALAILAEILWLQGFPDQAMRMVEENIGEATATGHATSLCNALAKACAVAVEAGPIETAENFLSVLPA